LFCILRKKLFKNKTKIVYKPCAFPHKRGMLKTVQELEEYCQKAATGAWLAIDTEFNRTTTYWAQLCLIQMNSPVAGITALDPMALGNEQLHSFYTLLQSQKVMKIIHSGRQDLEIFHVSAGVLPSPLFDTQVAASVLGYGEQVGYDKLVKACVGKGIDKSSRFTDWTRRPLRKEQIEYALDDVRYLPMLYETLRKGLEERGRGEWIQEEMAVLLSPVTYTPAPEDAWRKIKTRGGSAAFVGRVKVLATWREESAIRRNWNRTRVLRDEVLLKIAAEPPAHRDELVHFPAAGKAVQQEAAELFDRLATAEPVRTPPAPAWAGEPMPSLELLRLLLRIRCQQEEVAERLLASSDDLEKLARFAEKADVPCLQGWRYKVFGEQALALLEGRLTLRYDPAAKVVVVA
jgi:ribonuclease D